MSLDEQIVLVKAQLFDLQVELGLLREKMDNKMKELNELMKAKKNEGVRIT